jgi:hypothetical protein
MCAVGRCSDPDCRYRAEFMVAGMVTSNTAHVIDWRSASIPDLSGVTLFVEGEGMRSFRDVINETRMVAMMSPLVRNESPDYTDADNEPCCIFGRVLERLGIIIKFGDDLNYHSFPELPWKLWGFEEPNAYQRLWATLVQANADNGDAWIIALAMADATLI